MKILWHSGAPWVGSGYGQQTATFAPRIRDLGHDVALSATWGGGGAVLAWNDMQVFPSDGLYGNRTLPMWAKHHDADLVIILNDAWPHDPNMMRDLPVAIWTPVDHEPCPPRVAGVLKQSGARTIAMSRFGERMLAAEGLDPLYVPHGIDTNVFKPSGRAETRAQMGVTDDRFLVGMVANNAGNSPSRKAFPEALVAFRELYERHPDAYLYLHTELTGRPGTDAGVNIANMLERFEIPLGAVTFTDPTQMEGGIPPASLANIYSAFDVLLNPSMGEGFGIPIVEAQACGVPVIVSDWTAMPELVGAGWKVDGAPWYDTRHESWFMLPSIGSIIEALEEAYERRDDVGLREQAVKFAAQYDADLVTDTYWKPALETLGKPREVPPLPNRKHRRAARKTGVTA